MTTRDMFDRLDKKFDLLSGEVHQGFLGMQRHCQEVRTTCQQNIHGRIDHIDNDLSYMRGRSNGDIKRRNYEKPDGTIKPIVFLKEFKWYVILLIGLAYMAGGGSIPILWEWIFR